MILMYHKIHPTVFTEWWVSVDSFYRQMSQLQNKKIVYLDDYNINDTENVVITFDGIYKNIHEYALPILKHFNYPFELFITSDYIGNNNDFDIVEPTAFFASIEELNDLVKNRGRLQWHTKSHPNFNKNFQINQIINELTIPYKIKILDPFGFKWFAYPHGEFNDDVLIEVKKRFIGALSCNQGNDFDKFTLNRLTVLENTNFRHNKITCIIACYNYGEFLIEAVESVLRQTILPDEIIISDDCSDDDTELIAKNYVKKYPNLIKFNKNLYNMGIVDHFNKVVSITNSEYIMFLGADNRILSNYIEECSSILDSNKKIAIAYTDYAFFGNRSKVAYTSVREDFRCKVINNTFYQIIFPEFEKLDEMQIYIQNSNFIHGSSMFRRSAFNLVGGYLKSEGAEDHNLFKRILLKGFLAKKAKKTNLEYRQHSSLQANNIVGLHNQVLFYKELLITKNLFEESKIYKLSFIFFKIINTPLKDFFKKIISYFKNKYN
jgi:glycosyltransferase involved in cell wall biosynthesis